MSMGSLIVTTFVPKEDITAYELAIIYSQVHWPPNAQGTTVAFPPEKYDALSEDIRRHFPIKVRVEQAA